MAATQVEGYLILTKKAPAYPQGELQKAQATLGVHVSSIPAETERAQLYSAAKGHATAIAHAALNRVRQSQAHAVRRALRATMNIDMRRTSILVACLGAGVFAACGRHEHESPLPPHSVDDADDAASDSDKTTPSSSTSFALPVRQPFDSAAAKRGGAQLTAGALGRGTVPVLAIRNLWLVWEGSVPPISDAAYWASFRKRYGVYDAPFDNGGYPIGIRAVGDSVSFECFLCHASRVAGTTVIGVGNSELDLQALFDDLKKLSDIAPSYGYPSYPPPVTLTNRTRAAGANDAMGLGLYLAAKSLGATGMHTACGYQQPPTWWTLRHRTRHYLDGSGAAGGYRTMLATLFASGLSPSEIQAKDEGFADVYQYILSLDPPAWTLSTIDPSKAGRGRAVFDATCARCHGVHSGADARFDDTVVPFAVVGTDPLRAQTFDANDATTINASWFGKDHPMTATGGYLAPPLHGIWATAPYFHNGSVPDLAGVLDSTGRPKRWRRTGAEAKDYDAAQVGWRFEVVDTAPGTASVDARKVYDTTQTGLGNAGHTYGDALSAAEREDLLEYLRQL